MFHGPWLKFTEARPLKSRVSECDIDNSDWVKQFHPFETPKTWDGEYILIILSCVNTLFN